MCTCVCVCVCLRMHSTKLAQGGALTVGHGVQQPRVQHPEHGTDEHEGEGIAQQLQGAKGGTRDGV